MLHPYMRLSIAHFRDDEEEEEGSSSSRRKNFNILFMEEEK
jgi:hypothetical protein